MASNLSGGALALDRTSFTEQYRLLRPSSKSLHCISQKIELSNAHLSIARVVSFSEGSWLISKRAYMHSKNYSVSCYSRGTRETTKERARKSEDCTNLFSDLEKDRAGGSGTQICDKVVNKSTSTFSIVYNDAKYVKRRARNDIVLLSRGITQLNDRARQDVAVLGLGILKLDARAREDTEKICDKVIDESTSTRSIVYNDAKYVNERARNDIVLLSRGITQLNDRARQDVAVLGLGIQKLDEYVMQARAREDTEKIDHGMKKKAARLHHITTILKDKAESKLKRVADQHWSDGALEADLRRADFVVRRRAMEDAFMALKKFKFKKYSSSSEPFPIKNEFVKNIHDMMASTLYQQPQKEGSFTVNELMGFITLEKNGKSLDLLAREVSTDRVTAIQEAYQSMASALSEVDGIDYTDPEELELLVAALIDLDAMDGKGSASLLAECSSSPDVGTRRALANALAAAPSMWILGNAGMGALQRLAQDSNPAIAAAASKAIDELKQQWELEEGDSLRFMMNNSQEYGDESGSEEIDNSQV